MDNFVGRYSLFPFLRVTFIAGQIELLIFRSTQFSPCLQKFSIDMIFLETRVCLGIWVAMVTIRKLL